MAESKRPSFIMHERWHHQALANAIRSKTNPLKIVNSKNTKRMRGGLDGRELFEII